MGRFLIPALALAALYYAWQHPKGLAGLRDLVRPLALLALAILYLRIPFDLMPDVSAIGFLDDLLVLLAALYFGGGVDFAGERDSEAAGTRAGRSGCSGGARSTSDPYTVLGVSRGASQEQITRAFREKMKQYHPDRVADLGEDLQRVAHEKAVEIQLAYEALKRA